MLGCSYVKWTARLELLMKLVISEDLEKIMNSFDVGHVARIPLLPRV